MKWVAAVAIGVAGTSIARGDWPAAPENIQQHVIDLTKDSPALNEVKQRLPATLAEVKPIPERRASATADGRYMLCGDLFKNGGCFALYEPKAEDNPATLALAEWQKGKWELRGLWKMPVQWTPQEPKGRPAEIARLPFELDDLGADGVPEVIVSGEKMKYHQVRYLMHFDAKSHGLELLTYSLKKPVKAGNFVRLYDGSQNKASWSEWQFLEWQNGNLVERVIWHSEMAYRETDESFVLAEVKKAPGKWKRYRIDEVAGGEENEHAYKLSKDGKQIGSVAFEWKPETVDRSDSHNSEMAWIFEKLTGLPRQHYPDTQSYTIYKDGKEEHHLDELPELLEKNATAQFGGDAELQQIFMPPPKCQSRRRKTNDGRGGCKPPPLCILDERRVNLRRDIQQAVVLRGNEQEALLALA